MKEALDKKLVEKYPTLFADRYKSEMETAMCGGFECGDGWFNIIDTLCSNIQQYIDFKAERKEPVSQVVVFQVKEKFGGLRFYINGGDDTIDQLISFAEDMSYRTCDVCGNVGTVRTDGWIKTRCDDHEEA